MWLSRTRAKITVLFCKLTLTEMLERICNRHENQIIIHMKNPDISIKIFDTYEIAISMIGLYTHYDLV